MRRLCEPSKTTLITVDETFGPQIRAAEKAKAGIKARQLWMQERYPELFNQLLDAEAKVDDLKFRWKTLEEGNKTLQRHIRSKEVMEGALREAFEDPEVYFDDDGTARKHTVFANVEGGGTIKKTTYVATRFSYKKGG